MLIWAGPKYERILWTACLINLFVEFLGSIDTQTHPPKRKNPSPPQKKNKKNSYKAAEELKGSIQL